QRGLQVRGDHRQVARARQKHERNIAGLQDRAYGEAQIAAQLEIEHGAVEQVGARRCERSIYRQVRTEGVQAAVAQELTDDLAQKEIVLRNQDPAPVPSLAVSQIRAPSSSHPTETSERARSSPHCQRYWKDIGTRDWNSARVWRSCRNPHLESHVCGMDLPRSSAMADVTKITSASLI